MSPFHVQTPLIPSRPLSRLFGRRVWLKLDAVQPCGCYKIRGIGFACEEYVRRGAQRLLCSSGGNAGLAVAYAGRELGVSVTVIVPETTTERAKELIGREDAEVVVYGSSWNESHEYALSRSAEETAYIHPFDDPLTWRGHATVIDEVREAGLTPGAVVLSVGGGGLLCGVIEGLRRNDMEDVPVVAVETVGADSLYQAVQADHLIELEAITSIATTLGAKRVARQAFEYAKEKAVLSTVVDDRAAVDACIEFARDHRLIVEPACGAALAVIYEHDSARTRTRSTLNEISDREDILVIVCGGAGVTMEQLEGWRKVLR